MRQQSSKPSKIDKSLLNIGWRFNNETILLMEELKLLTETENKISQAIVANTIREEGLNEIRQYISDRVGSSKSHK